ncbi:MAG: hypothetical protein E6Q97_18040 [Desulfurellales bacterium]|nr:MAG: hypothetical protein E6Q97_18040 [Desulfurellales bacterium]
MRVPLLTTSARNTSKFSAINLKRLSNMSFCNIFQDVAEFHDKVLEYPQSVVPTLYGAQPMVERLAFLNEELDETIAADSRDDIVAVVDGLLDLIYVAAGTLHTMGIGPAAACEMWNYVQQANMAKERGGTNRRNFYDARKPVGWRRPDDAIANCLRALGATVSASYDVGLGASAESTGDVPQA